MNKGRKVLLSATSLTVLAFSSGCSESTTDERVSSSNVRFTDVTAAAGLAMRSPTFAVAAGDVDADGFPDLAVSLHGRLALFVNQQDGTFVRADSIADFEGGDTHGVSLLDANDDAWPDLFVSLGAQRGRGLGVNHLYLNEAGQRFVRAASLDAMLEDDMGRGRSVCPTDVDKDGVMDLILMNLSETGRPHHVAITTAGEPPGFAEGADEAFRQVGAEAVLAVDLDGTGETSYLFSSGGPDAGALHRRRPDGSFGDESPRLGLDPNWGVRAVVPFDYDRDGDFDLFVARGSYLPEGAELQGRRVYFRFDATPDRTPKGIRIPMPNGPIEINIRFEGRVLPDRLSLGRTRVNPDSLPWTLDPTDPALQGDPRVDSTVDEGGFLWRSDDGYLVFTFVGVQGEVEEASGYISTATAPPDAPAVFGARPRSQYHNNLYRNEGGQFTDVTETARVLGEGLSSDALAADFDNDGNLDLYVVNGGQAFGNPANQLYLNQGDGTFVEVAQAAGAAGPDEGRGNAAVALDYDQDGDLDLFLLNGAGPWPHNDGPLKLLRNDTPAQGGSLQLELRGRRGNTLSMGATVTAEVDGRVQYQQRFCGNGHMATHVLPLHVGLGAAKQAGVTISWPSGRRVSLTASAGSRQVVEEQE